VQGSRSPAAAADASATAAEASTSALVAAPAPQKRGVADGKQVWAPKATQVWAVKAKVEPPSEIPLQQPGMASINVEDSAKISGGKGPANAAAATSSLDVSSTPKPDFLSQPPQPPKPPALFSAGPLGGGVDPYREVPSMQMSSKSGLEALLSVNTPGIGPVPCGDDGGGARGEGGIGAAGGGGGAGEGSGGGGDGGHGSGIFGGDVSSGGGGWGGGGGIHGGGVGLARSTSMAASGDKGTPLPPKDVFLAWVPMRGGASSSGGGGGSGGGSGVGGGADRDDVHPAQKVVPIASLRFNPSALGKQSEHDPGTSTGSASSSTTTSPPKAHNHPSQAHPQQEQKQQQQHTPVPHTHHQQQQQKQPKPGKPNTGGKAKFPKQQPQQGRVSLGGAWRDP